MADYSRALMHFGYAAARAAVGTTASAKLVEVFCFGTRLSRITQEMQKRDPDVAFDAAEIENPIAAVRQLTDCGRGADAVIEAVGREISWEWALEMVRKGGTVNLFAGCVKGTEVKLDSWRLHYSEITIKSTLAFAICSATLRCIAGLLRESPYTAKRHCLVPTGGAIRNE